MLDRRGMGARISCAYAGVNVHPKVFEGDRKALIQNRRRQPTPFNRTKAIILHSVKIEPRSSLLEKPFRLFFVQSIEKFFSLPHISRQTASGLRKDRPGFSKGRPLLQVAPLEKTVHRTVFEFTLFERLRGQGSKGRRPLDPCEPLKRLDLNF